MKIKISLSKVIAQKSFLLKKDQRDLIPLEVGRRLGIGPNRIRFKLVKFRDPFTGFLGDATQYTIQVPSRGTYIPFIAYLVLEKVPYITDGISFHEVVQPSESAGRKIVEKARLLQSM